MVIIVNVCNTHVNQQYCLPFDTVENERQENELTETKVKLAAHHIASTKIDHIWN